ncbi:MAG TPA: phage major capsid protein [Thermoanaerobaculales bacterium]|nr:phage major capsid protein [Thermoanaerobaculales bacterium]HQL30862.1 phage major capsid protein [Thermoanaerobaculales bacterium]
MSVKIVHDNAASAPWDAAGDPRRGFGNFLAAVAQAAGGPRLSGQIDPRLRRTAAPSGTNEGIPSEGGFLVESETVLALELEMFEASVLADRCFPVEVGDRANGARVPLFDETDRTAGSRWGGVQVAWASEASEITASRPTTRVVDIELGRCRGLWYVTGEEVEDVTYLENVGLTAFGGELAFAVDEAITRGTGVGSPLGVLNGAGLVTVSAEVGQPAATVEARNLARMWARLPAASRRRAVWLVHPDAEGSLQSEGTALLGARSAVQYGDEGARIFGRPAFASEHCSALGTVGDVVLVDPGWYALLRKIGGPKGAGSMHVAFTTDEWAFRFTYRVNGCPMCTSAITPARGTNTVSPYVTLAARA